MTEDQRMAFRALLAVRFAARALAGYLGAEQPLDAAP